MTKVNNIDQALVLSSFDEAVQQTFEAYFFMEAMPLAAPFARLSPSESIEVELIFRGPFSGHLHLLISIETALGLISSLPIAVHEVNDALVADLFAEITNTIGGRIAAALAGDDFSFDLTIPEVTIGSHKASEGQSVARLYQTDFGTIGISVSHLTEHKANYAKGA